MRRWGVGETGKSRMQQAGDRRQKKYRDAITRFESFGETKLLNWRLAV